MSTIHFASRMRPISALPPPGAPPHAKYGFKFCAGTQDTSGADAKPHKMCRQPRSSPLERGELSETLRDASLAKALNACEWVAVTLRTVCSVLNQQ